MSFNFGRIITGINSQNPFVLFWDILAVEIKLVKFFFSIVLKLLKLIYLLIQKLIVGVLKRCT